MRDPLPRQVRGRGQGPHEESGRRRPADRRSWSRMTAPALRKATVRDFVFYARDSLTQCKEKCPGT